MRDPIVRAAFHNSVLTKEHLDGNTIVLDELGLQNGLVRADIAVLNGCMVGYEIKTAKDTVARLPAQIAAYSQIFDKAFLITDAKHLPKALQLLPDWWGIYTIEVMGERCYFDLYRPAVQNYQKDATSIARLLWKDELSEIIANNFSQRVRKNVTKFKLYEMLAKHSDADQLGLIALKYLKSRINWRTNH
jgi:hypothetical protein